MPRRTTQLLLVASGLGSLIVGLALRTPWREAGVPLPNTHTDRQMAEGLRQLQPQNMAAPGASAAASAPAVALARARAWLQRQTPQMQQAVMAAAPDRLPGLLARRNPYPLPGCLTAPALATTAPASPNAACGWPGHPALDWNARVPAAAELGSQLAAQWLDRRPGRHGPQRGRRGRTGIHPGPARPLAGTRLSASPQPCQSEPPCDALALSPRHRANVAPAASAPSPGTPPPLFTSHAQN